MRTTIDKQIKGLEYLKKCGIFPFLDTKTGIVFDDKCIDDALNTIHKYQKIEEIMNQWTNGSDLVDSMVAISEVLEDGKND